MEFIEKYFDECLQVIREFDRSAVDGVVRTLKVARERQGRVFVLGVGGSAATASHMVNDLRKILLIESYAPTDNVAELTARTNDEGWSSSFSGWLRGSRLNAADVVFVLSVGGGNSERNVSPNLVEALVYARVVGASIVGVVGRDGGYTASVADACVIVPTVNSSRVTAHTEAFHSVICHLLVSHPDLKAVQTKWESIAEPAR
jgi:D-sedoheptulose 7-phosphate isomerase